MLLSRDGWCCDSWMRQFCVLGVFRWLDSVTDADQAPDQRGRDCLLSRLTECRICSSQPWEKGTTSAGKAQQISCMQSSDIITIK